MKHYKISSENNEPIEMSESEVEELRQLSIDNQKTQYKTNRAISYPDFREYLDGIVKNDQAQIQAYIDACLAVKAKYPKPE